MNTHTPQPPFAPEPLQYYARTEILLSSSIRFVASSATAIGGLYMLQALSEIGFAVSVPRLNWQSANAIEPLLLCMMAAAGMLIAVGGMLCRRGKNRGRVMICLGCVALIAFQLFGRVMFLFAYLGYGSGRSPFSQVSIRQLTYMGTQLLQEIAIPIFLLLFFNRREVRTSMTG